MDELLNGGTQTKAVKKLSMKQVSLLIAGVLFLVIGILAAVLLRHPNFKMSDFGEINKISAVIKFGMPSRVSDEGDLIYDDCIEFYGVTVRTFMVNCDDDEFTIFEYDDDKKTEISSAIMSHCDYESVGYSYMYYNYKDLKITTDNDGYVKIKVR